MSNAKTVGEDRCDSVLRSLVYGRGGVLTLFYRLIPSSAPDICRCSKKHLDSSADGD